ncbi:MAG TPA: hypothetical protein VMI53_07180 [Opitutaceae bacterium]|nr:hypothetical protein [Opitutaceae bacterium]
MKITPWTMIYFGVAILAGMAGPSSLIEQQPSNDIYVFAPFFLLFTAWSTYFSLSTRYEKTKDRLGWSLPIWSSSPFANPQSNRLFQVLAFGSLGITAVVAGVLRTKDYEFGILSLTMSVGILCGWMLFRMKMRRATVREVEQASGKIA